MSRRTGILLLVIAGIVIIALLVNDTAKRVIKARTAQQKDARIEQTLNTINNVITVFK